MGSVWDDGGRLWLLLLLLLDPAAASVRHAAGRRNVCLFGSIEWVWCQSGQRQVSTGSITVDRSTPQARVACPASVFFARRPLARSLFVGYIESYRLYVCTHAQQPPPPTRGFE